ncbi:carboxypeptidase-like regulatory domain-containing protein [Mucilaginibacter auburnensis]|uniref:Carboxypeptidase-like protein n=1 Tax=Mucilaginibacter auburnensis TaxID=1457233 RepID=A0A2H9VPG0_9SPHI|nr:carboxypeptidase-like regulatory domain-containing protein [Mucilaginibacter auburnensis]PJJ80216.1 carboxypeptidase-like protein [Mucilaginibacter auburnensis]
MDTNKADILQIKKYLEGKLDARAMHELERRALGDPFLMDALEGFETAGNQDKAAAQLNVTLQKRIERPEAKVFTLGRLAVAASVIAVLGVGVWLFNSRQPVIQPQVAGNAPDKTTVAPSPQVIEPQISINKDSLLAVNIPKAVIRSPRSFKKAYRHADVQSDVGASSDETAEIASASGIPGTGTLEEMAMRSRSKTDSVPLNELIVVSMGRQRRADKAGAVSAPVAASAKIIQGKVVSASDGAPLAGVTVRAGATGTVAVTGADGAYTLKADSNNTNLTYNFIGYQTKKLDVDGNAKPNIVALEPENASLSEVVVVKTVDKTGGAHPKNGWENYRKYLNANAVSPDGNKGTYRVSFTVEKDGTLSNFQINKAGDDAAGQKAIQLIKNGPEWIGNGKKDEKKVITLKFKEAGN